MKFCSQQDIQNAINDPDFDINTNDENGYTALTYAMSHSFGLQVLESLLIRGANINLEDKNKNTPLLAAVKHSNFLYVQKLIQHNARADLANSEGVLPLTIANEKNLRLISELLQNACQKSENKSAANLSFFNPGKEDAEQQTPNQFYHLTIFAKK